MGKLFVELVVAILTKPHKAVHLLGLALYLQYQAHSISATLRRVRCAPRQQEHIALFDGYIYDLAIFLYAHYYITFQLVKEFFTFIVVKILTAVGAAHYHHDEIICSFIYALVAHRRLQQVAVISYPLVEVERT